MANLSKEELRQIQKAIDIKLADAKRENSQEELIGSLSMLNEAMMERVVDAINNIEIAVPSVEVPKVDIPPFPEVKVPAIDISGVKEAIVSAIKDTKVEVNVPEAKVTVDIPDIKVPTPEVTVNVPDIEIPKIEVELPEMPEQMTITGDVGLRDVNLKKPLPVTMLDLKGRPISFGDGGGGFSIVGLKDKSNTRVNPAQFSDYRLEIARENIPGMSFEHKFGEAGDVDTLDGFVDVWDGVLDANADKTYTYSTTADIDSISSSNAGDGQDIEIKGLDKDFNLVTQTVTLNGQTRVALTTPLIRAFRMKNEGTTDLAGVVYCYVNGAITLGVPDTSADIRAIINNGNNQTLMALYTIPAGTTGYLTKGFSTISKKKTAIVEVRFATRATGGVFQLKEVLALGTAGNSSFQYEYPIPLPIPAKTDLRVQAATDTNDVGVSAAFDIILIDN